MDQATNVNAFDTRKHVRLDRDDYTIACLVPLGIEMAPLRAMLDAIHEDIPATRDHTAYILGRFGQHNVVVAALPSIGNNDSGAMASQLKTDFPNVQYGLLVGIAGGVPGRDGKDDIRLGDVVVSEVNGTSAAVLQFDRGKRRAANKFELTGHLNSPPQLLATAVKKLKAQHLNEGNQVQSLASEMLRKYPKMKEHFDWPRFAEDFLFEPEYEHNHGDTCQECDKSRTVSRLPRQDNEVKVHYGTIGTSNAVLRDALERDRLHREYHVLAVEMEAAGLMNILPSLVIRGICDYADSHKNKLWQPYAAVVAAAYTKELLKAISPKEVFTLSQDLSLPISLSEQLRKTGRRTNVDQYALSKQDQEVFDRLLPSLGFERWDARQLSIAEPLAKTCTWLFENHSFQLWAERSHYRQYNGFLWIKGKPGSGKSTLMKIALTWARKNWSQETIVSYFFNARAPGELERSSLGFYRSIAYQLLHACPQLQRDFLHHFRSKAMMGSSVEWTLLELRAFLESSMRALQNLNLFVDALDEGDEDDVRQLVAFLEDLSRNDDSSRNIRICLSSRHFPYISIERGLFITVEFERGHRRDLETYIDTKLPTWKSSDKAIFKKEILEKSANVFLWVVLVVTMLRKAYDRGRSAPQMKRLLKEIPRELDELFTQMIGQNDEDRDEFLSLLQWVLFSATQLRPIELFLAIQCSSPDSCNEDEEISEGRLQLYLLNTSRGLVELTKSNPPTVQFVHETVRDFLQRVGLALIDISLRDNAVGRSHDKIAQVCLQCIKRYAASVVSSTSLDDSHEYKLSDEEIEERTAEQLRPMRDQSLLVYAVRNIFMHANLAQSHGMSQLDWLLELHRNDHTILKSWIGIYRSKVRHHFRFTFSKDSRLIYILACLNYESLVIVLTKANIDVNAQEKRRSSSPLIAACENGSLPVARALIDAGADVNPQIGFYGDALQTACRLGYEDIVLLLIDNGADVNAHGGDYGTALQAAFHSSSEKIISLLIGSGADVNTQDGLFGHVLQAACHSGYEQVVRLLIEHGADVNAQGGHHGSALQAACHKGNKNIASLLIDRGADVNAQGGAYGSALQVACHKGNPKIVRLLIEKGANINAQGGLFGNALQTMYNYGYDDIGRLLIENGADVNARGGYYGSALQAVCYRGNTESMRLLLGKGADVNAQGGRYGSALQAACYRGNTEIVRLLLETGANVNTPGGYHGSALQAACCSVNIGIVRLLLEKGADANARGGSFGSALKVSRLMRATDIVQVLLQAGAYDHDSESSQGNTVY